MAQTVDSGNIDQSIPSDVDQHSSFPGDEKSRFYDMMFIGQTRSYQPEAEMQYMFVARFDSGNNLYFSRRQAMNIEEAGEVEVTNIGGSYLNDNKYSLDSGEQCPVTDSSWAVGLQKHGYFSPDQSTPDEEPAEDCSYFIDC